MKRTIAILAVCFAMTACYDDFVRDYDYSAVYSAYQYDLRTFIPGEEDLEVSFTVALSGVIDNDRDRKVHVSIDKNLLTSDLSVLDEDGETAPFTALDGLKGNGKFGDMSRNYVKNEVSAAGLTALTPLPEAYYTQSPSSDLVIAKGSHTAKLRLTPTPEMFKDEKMLKPYYALAFKIEDADADRIPSKKCFQIMAVKVENSFYGNWYHGGRMIVSKDKDGSVISENKYAFSLPQADNRIYALRTESVQSVLTDKIANQPGTLRLVFGGNNTVTVEDPSGEREIRPVNGKRSYHNGAKLLQDRKIFLNYCWNNGDGTSTYVVDTLFFRNRVRDGMSEWQDENPAHYE